MPKIKGKLPNSTEIYWEAREIYWKAVIRIRIDSGLSRPPGSGFAIRIRIQGLKKQHKNVRICSKLYLNLQQ